MRTYFLILALAASFAITATAQQPEASKPVATQTPAPAATQSQQTASQTKPDSPAVVKMRLKAFEAEQKQALRLAKAQTAEKLAELRLGQVSAKYNKKVAVEVARGGN